MPPAVCWTPAVSPYTAQRAALDFPQPFRTLEDARTFLTIYGGERLRRTISAPTYFHRRSGLPVAAARRPPLWNDCIFNRRRRTHMNKTKRLLALVPGAGDEPDPVCLRPEGSGRQDRRQHPDRGHHPRVHRLLRPRGHRPHRYPEGRRLRPSYQMVVFAIAPTRWWVWPMPGTRPPRITLTRSIWTCPCWASCNGGKGELNLETLLTADPDVVIDVGEPKSTMAEDLDGLQEQTGIPFVHIDAYLASMDDTYAMLSDLLAMPNEGQAWPTTAAMPMTPSRPSWTAWKADVLYITGEEA